MEKKSYIVGIGASAGGLEAIQELFQHVPPDIEMAFVIVQHLSPNFKSLMDELLQKHTELPVRVAKDDTLIESGQIYLNPRDKNLICQDGRLYHVEKQKDKGLNLPIDVFFHSLAQDQNEHAVGVVLSGTGTDGSRGIGSIRQMGGTVIAQEPSTCKFDGMPNSAIASGYTEQILSPKGIAEVLTRISIIPPLRIKQELEQGNDVFQKTYQNILNLLNERTGINFELYKSTTLLRRMEKRIGLSGFTELDQYYKFLLDSPAEIEALKTDCLIGVTHFFRDQEAFEVIKGEILPEVFEKRSYTDPVRIWISGCSTGEEPYSLAMIIEEFLEENRLNTDYKIFASDVSPDAISYASAGRYPLNHIAEISQDRLEKYFLKSGDRFQIVKNIREKIVFTVHNLVKDPPFINMDFISCRNLLIYMKHETQKKIIQTFQFSLRKQGILFLGSSENIQDTDNEFEVLDSKWRIYRKQKEGKRLPQPWDFSGFNQSNSFKNVKKPRTLDSMDQGKINKSLSYLETMAERYAPASVFIDGDFNIQYINGNLNKLLSFPTGSFEQNLLKLLHEDLAAVIKNGVRRVIDKNQSIRFDDITINREDDQVTLDLVFVKIPRQNEKIYLIEFHQKQKDEGKAINETFEPDVFYKNRIGDLEKELGESKQELQSLVQELETSNEELQSSNEELLASNEELQSTNEELQSLNEELYTVNTELQVKNKELEGLNNDVNNLLASTGIAVLFVDNELRIRKFTDEIQTIFSLKSSDVGRSIDNFASKFENVSGKQLQENCQSVINSGEAHYQEIMVEGERHFLKQINPFKTTKGVIEGAVITFIDVSESKRQEETIRKMKDRLELALSMGKLAWWEWDYRSGEVLFSDEKVTMLGYNPHDFVRDVNAFTNLIHPDDYDHTMQNMRNHLEGKSPMYEVEYRIRKKDGGYVWYYDKGGVVDRDEDGKPLKITGIVINVDEKKRSEQKISLLNNAMVQSPSPILITNPDGVIEYVNPSYCNLSGYAEEEIIGQSPSLFKSGKHPNSFYENLWNTVLSRETWKGEIINKNKNGHLYWEVASISPIFDRNGKIVNFVKVAEDITHQMKIQEELRSAKAQAEEADKLKSAFLANMSHEIRTPMNSILGFGQLLKDSTLSVSEQQNFIDIINSQGEYLLSLINDIIDISKIESGAIRIRKDECRVDQLMGELKKMFDVRNLNSIDFRLSAEESLNHPVYTDAIRLKQILINLLGNALKFTEKGYVEFGYGFSPDKKYIKFFVKDTGPGIPDDKLKRVFERFYQLENDHKGYKSRGTGLGLSITKVLVELLGGHIEVNSELHVGSEFKFTIPYWPVSDIKESNEIGKEDVQNIFKGKKILVVDDIKNNYIFISYLLKSTGADCIYAHSGDQAIRMVKNDDTIDLILMDVNMPGMDGYETTGKIKKVNTKIPVIAQTAYAMEGDKDIALDAGCDDYLSKPLKKDQLIEKIILNLSNHR